MNADVDASASPPGAPAPPTIGDTLRRAREARGLSLAKLAQDTRIAIRFLEALERNESEPFPAEVYLQGSLRSYANALGLDGAALVRRFYEEKAGGPAESSRATSPEGTPRPAPRDGSPLWRQSALLVAGLLALLTLVLIRWHQMKSSRPAHAVAGSVVGAGLQAGPPSLPAQAVPLKLHLEAVENTWARIKTDNARVFEGILPEGATRQFEANNRFTVRVSKALGLMLTFEGRRVELVRPPESEHVKELTLDREGVRLREIRRAIAASPATPPAAP